MWASGGLMTVAVALLASAPFPASAARAVEGSTHLSVSTTDAKGHVGDTVGIRVTVTNHGPAVEPEWALTGVQTQEGTRFASGTGCRPDPDGGQYCSSPGPLAVGKSQTVVLHYKIVKTVPHPDWEMGGFSFYEALDRKGGTDDVDLSFHISILGTGTSATKPRTTRTPATVRSTSASTGRPSAARRTASPAPSQAGTTSADASEPPAMLAAPQADPTPSLTAAGLPTIEDAGFTAHASRTAWAVAAGGIAVVGSSAFTMLVRGRRRRARTAASDMPVP